MTRELIRALREALQAALVELYRVSPSMSSPMVRDAISKADAALFSNSHVPSRQSMASPNRRSRTMNEKEVRRLAAKAKLPRYMWDTPDGRDALARFAALCAQPAPARLPLTEEQIDEVGRQVHGFIALNPKRRREFARAIEAAHGISPASNKPAGSGEAA